MNVFGGNQGKLLAFVFLCAAIAFAATALVFEEDRLTFALVALANLGASVAFFTQRSRSSGSTTASTPSAGDRGERE